MSLHFDIIKDFSPVFGGKTRNDGKYSAESLREDYLVPLLKKRESEQIIIINLGDDIDECNYASNFLREAFAGLIEHNHISYSDFVKNIKFVYGDEDFDFYVERIYKYASEYKTL